MQRGESTGSGERQLGGKFTATVSTKDKDQPDSCRDPPQITATKCNGYAIFIVIDGAGTSPRSSIELAS